MADNNVQLPVWTNVNPFKLFNSSKKRHGGSTPRHNHNWNCTKRHLHKWISNSTRTQLWKQNTLRGYLRDIKLKIAEQQDNDDVTMDENDENNNKNNDKNNNETNDENHDENMDDDSNNDEDNSDDAILQAMDVAQVCLYTL